MVDETYDLWRNVDFVNGKRLPPIDIPHRPEDVWIRYDGQPYWRISYDFYDGVPEYWVVIRLANPIFKNEFMTPIGAAIRIPMPIETILDEIDDQILRR